MQQKVPGLEVIYMYRYWVIFDSIFAENYGDFCGYSNDETISMECQNSLLVLAVRDRTECCQLSFYIAVATENSNAIKGYFSTQTYPPIQRMTRCCLAESENVVGDRAKLEDGFGMCVL